MILLRSWIAVLAPGFLVVCLIGRVTAFPVDGDQTTLPPKTELNEDALDKPREISGPKSPAASRTLSISAIWPSVRPPFSAG
jgi:hypothetical protein